MNKLTPAPRASPTFTSENNEAGGVTTINTVTKNAHGISAGAKA